MWTSKQLLALLTLRAPLLRLLTMYTVWNLSLHTFSVEYHHYIISSAITSHLVGPTSSRKAIVHNWIIRVKLVLFSEAYSILSVFWCCCNKWEELSINDDNTAVSGDSCSMEQTEMFHKQSSVTTRADRSNCFTTMSVRLIVASNSLSEHHLH